MKKKLKFLGQVIKIDNHVFIVLDAVRWDVYNSTKFENLPNKALKSYSGAVWTLPSFFNYLHGYSPSGAEKFAFDVGNQCSWLPYSLRKKGYNTGFHSGSAWMAMNDKAEVFSRGFDEYDIELEKDRMDEFAQYSDYEEPFFHLFHVLEPHHPFYNGEEETEAKRDKQHNREAQEEALKYVDEKFGEMISKLPDNTVITVTADHADAWGEGDPPSWGHNPNCARMEGFQIKSMPEELTKIPYARGRKKDGKVIWEDPENLELEWTHPKKLNG